MSELSGTDLLFSNDSGDQRKIEQEDPASEYTAENISGIWKIKSSENLEEFLKLRNAGALQNAIFRHSNITIKFSEEDTIKISRQLGTKLIGEQFLKMENGKDVLEHLNEHSPDSERYFMKNEQLHVISGSNCTRIYEKSGNLKEEYKRLQNEQKEVSVRIKTFEDIEKSIRMHEWNNSSILKDIIGTWELKKHDRRLTIKIEDFKIHILDHDIEATVHEFWNSNSTNFYVYLQDNKIFKKTIEPDERGRLSSEFYLEDGLLWVKNHYIEQPPRYVWFVRVGEERPEIPKEVLDIAKKLDGRNYPNTIDKIVKLVFEVDPKTQQMTFAYRIKDGLEGPVNFGFSTDWRSLIFVRNNSLVHLGFDEKFRFESQLSFSREFWTGVLRAVKEFPSGQVKSVLLLYYPTEEIIAWFKGFFRWPWTYSEVNPSTSETQ